MPTCPTLTNMLDIAASRKTRLLLEGYPLLGDRHAVVYKLCYEPLAPHTLPSDAYLVVDRRLLPGDDPDAATAEIQAVIGDLAPYTAEVSRDVFMLPALVDPADLGVEALRRSHLASCGEEAPLYYSQGAFDCGGIIACGVPAVMYGAGGGEGLLGADFVPVRAVENEAAEGVRHPWSARRSACQ